MVVAFTFAFSPGDLSVLNPFLLVNTAGFTLSKQADPCRQKPAGHHSTETSKTEFPQEKCAQSIGNRAAQNSIANHDAIKVNPANRKKPRQSAGVFLDEMNMRSHRFDQGLVVQCQ